MSRALLNRALPVFVALIAFIPTIFVFQNCGKGFDALGIEDLASMSSNIEVLYVSPTSKKLLTVVNQLF